MSLSEHENISNRECVERLGVLCIQSIYPAKKQSQAVLRTSHEKFQNFLRTSFLLIRGGLHPKNIGVSVRDIGSSFIEG